MNKPEAFVVDFDGTVTTRDMSDELLDVFVGSVWRQLYPEGTHPREWLTGTARLLPDNPKLLLEYILANVEVRPGFAEFVTYCQNHRIPVIVASDGFGFYIEAVLKQVGIEGVVIYRNDVLFNGTPSPVIRHPHETCLICGNCKARVVRELRRRHGCVGYIGDGCNDKFGSSHADVVFARDCLANIYDQYGIAYVYWEHFFQVVDALCDGITCREPQSLCPPGINW